MKKVISIGINQATGLMPLQAAVSGAKEFDAWAQSQGYETTLFTDENNIPVSVQDVFNAIHTCVQSRRYEQLIVFFAGHGILKSPGQELWLLSGVKSNPNEAVNLTGSVDYARTCGIPYVVFISDACRVLSTDLYLSGNGSVIFPIENSVQDCAIDIFYATKPGSPAHEVNFTESSRKFGIFTECLLDTLKGKFPELLHTKTNAAGFIPMDGFYDAGLLAQDIQYKELQPGQDWEVYTPLIFPKLKAMVTERIGEISIALNQSPDIIVQYQTNQPSLARFDDTTGKQLLLAATQQSIPVVTNPVEDVFEMMQEHVTADGGPPEAMPELHQETKSFSAVLSGSGLKYNKLKANNSGSDLLQNSKMVFNAKGRQSFETETGFTVIGRKVQDVVVTEGRRDIFQDGDVTHIRIHESADTLTALFVFRGGKSIPLAILKGYVGTLVFVKNKLLTVNYTPSMHNDRYAAYAREEATINFARAFVASAANEGFDYRRVFAREFGEAGGFYGAGSLLRREKAIDPSLGLYAAYAYRQEGKLVEIQSVYNYMAEDNLVVPFDVTMLCGKLENPNRGIAPFCPMLSLGWAYRDRFEELLAPEIREAARYLEPDLWTTFTKKGTLILTESFKNGILK
jgi:hypothetical protein